MKVRITKRVVDSLKPNADGKRIKVYDDQLTGFGLVVYPTGKKSFFLEYGPRGRQRRLTIGPYGPLTVETARSKAISLLGEVVDGADPLQDREKQRAMPTFSAWADEYLSGVRLRKRQPRHDELHLKRAKERWARTPLDQISRRDVEAMMRNIGEKTPTSANRWLASVRACFAAAWRSDIIQANPAMGIKPFKEGPPRSRVLTDNEMTNLIEEIDKIDDAHVRAAFLLLIETGARKSEVLQARWEDFDLEQALWRIPSPKAGYPQMMPITSSTVELLKGLPRLGEFVIPGPDTEKPRKDLKRPWEDLRKAAELKDVNIHDLRRTYGLHASRLVGLHVASKLLRHSDVRVTERVYAPLGIEELKEAAEQVSTTRANVIPLRRKG